MKLEARQLAVRVQRVFFYHTPYRSGNLARSVGDVGYRGDQKAGFAAFSMVQAPYGAMLNDYPTIRRNVITKSGEVRTWEYTNKHFDWINKGVNKAVDDLILFIPNARRG